MVEKEFWIVKDFDDRLVAVFTDEEDFRRFFDPEIHEYMEVVL